MPIMQRWLGSIGLLLALAGLGQAQCWQKPCCAPCVPAAPSAAAPGAEPIPAPQDNPPEPLANVPYMPESDIGMDLGGGELSTFDSSVGYIDSAIPNNLLRLRIDAAWNANRPTRAEFFYARGQPLGPGLPDPEFRVDYQEIMAYAEGKLGRDFSVFIETPVRFLNPELNGNHAGYGDMNFGCKYAFQNCPAAVSSFQLRAWVPTGDADMGLGNNHVSLEPALLIYRRLSDRVRMEGELRYWIPIGGTDFAGDIIRYGIGFSYGDRPVDEFWLTPVVEVVGWTVLDGMQAVAPPLPSVAEDAAGDTIVNIKLGVRLGLGNIADFYTGYGRALTGDVWYKDIWRTELRFAF